MVCPYCGKPNNDDERRCGHCGRRLGAKPRGTWERTGLDDEAAFPRSLPPSQRYKAPPPPDPPWKEELQKKLEDYRSRRQGVLDLRPPSDEAEEKETAAAEQPAGGNVVPFDRFVAGRGGWTLEQLRKLGRTAQGPDASAGKPGPGASAPQRPGVDPQWRKVGGPGKKAAPGGALSRRGGKPFPARAERSTPPSQGPAAPGVAAAAGAQPAPSRPRASAGSSAGQMKLPPLGTRLGDFDLPVEAEPETGEGEVQPPHPRDVACGASVASLGMRFAAATIDLMMILLSAALFAGVFWLWTGRLEWDAASLPSLAGAVTALTAFYWIFYVRYAGETPGMMCTGLRTLNFDGAPPESSQLRTRAFGYILSSLTLGLGFVWALLDEEGLTWHDRMSKTFLSRAAVPASQAGADDGGAEEEVEEDDSSPPPSASFGQLPPLPGRKSAEFSLGG